jgi:hypothetical protein
MHKHLWIEEFNLLYPEYQRHKYYKLYWSKKILPHILTIKREICKIVNKKTKITRIQIYYSYIY